MSFILEALKKADAERDRGAVPDLHAQVLLPEAAFAGESPAGARPWVWLAAGAAAALLAIAGWQWSTSEKAAPPAPVLPPTAVPVVRPADQAAPTADAAPASAVPAVPAVRAEPEATANAQAQPPGKTNAQAQPEADASAADGAAHAEGGRGRKTPASTVSRAMREDAGEARPKAQAEAEAQAKAQAKAEAKAGATTEAKAESGSGVKAEAKAAPHKPAARQEAEQVPLLAELPAEIRAQVPALKLGGLVYSAAPASRMLIVNGDVQREGSTIAPGLTLERIKPKSAVFSLRGQRFEIPI